MVAVRRIVVIPLLVATHVVALWLGIRDSEPEAAPTHDGNPEARASVRAIGVHTENETRGRSNAGERDHQAIGPRDDVEAIVFRAMVDRDMDRAVAAMKEWLDRDPLSALHQLGVIHRSSGSSRLSDALEGRYAGGKWDLFIEDLQSVPVARGALLSAAAEECKKTGDPRAAYRLAAAIAGRKDRFELLAEALGREAVYENLPETRRLLGEPAFSFLIARYQGLAGGPEEDVARKLGQLRAAGASEHFVRWIETSPRSMAPDADEESADPFSSEHAGDDSEDPCSVQAPVSPGELRRGDSQEWEEVSE